MIRAYLLSLALTGSPAMVRLATSAASGDGGLSLDTLVQTGVTGTLAAALLVFARTAYAREVARADRNETRLDEANDLREACAREAARADREAARADRNEAKLDEINDAVLTRYAGALADATRAVADATTTLSRVR